MIFVNTSEDVAQERNQQRSRTLARDEVTRMWNEVQKNIGAFQSLFGAEILLLLTTIKQMIHISVQFGNM